MDPLKTVDQYLVDHWEMFDGLPSDTVKSITQTPDGYLWIGTSKGLVRFDGVKFVTVPFAKKEGTYPREIRQLFVDREGLLWIGTSVGLTLYRSSRGQFKVFTVADGITDDGVRRIKDDMRGNIWVSFTASFVNRLSNGKFFAFNADHGLLGKKINAIVEDRRGNLLFGTHENGIFIYRDDKFLKYLIPNLDNVLIIAMHEDRSGDLWVGTTTGLFRVHRVTGKEIDRFTTGNGLAANHINSIMESSNGHLWIGTVQGLNRIKKRADGSIGFESLLKPCEIYSIFEDREKGIWIGTDNSGIFRLKDSKFMPYAPLEAHPAALPASLFEDRQGDIWIGTARGKLFRCRGTAIIDSVEISELSGTGIAAIAEDAEGNLWLGTTGKGVFQKRNGTFIQFTTRHGLADNVVKSIYRDRRDNLWFSTFDGVSVRRAGDNVIQSFNSGGGLSGKAVHNVYESSAGDIWIAADKGVTILRGGKTAKQNIDHYLPAITVTSIYEDTDVPDEKDKIYWIATEGAGLKRLNLENGTVTSYTTAQGMTTNVLYQFLEDPQGNFWLMSDSGILRVSKSELKRLAHGSKDKINCISYGITDGMKSLEFDNKFSRHSALKAGNGEFWFITKKGITIVNPRKISINKTPPQVAIEVVCLNGQSFFRHPEAGPVVVKGMSDLSFHFTALTFLSPRKTSFKFQLEGVDREWVFLLPGQERTAHYKDLSPGTYTFRVTACNAEGVWNRKGDSVIFTLKPLFYQTALFKIAVLLLVIVLTTAALFLYKKMKRIFEQKAKYKGSPLDPHFADECVTKLSYLMDIERVYCDPDITLQSLAGKMSIASHQLSQLLNEKLSRNFFDFINSYRIEEAKRILQSPRGARRKISSVATDVGFNTMAAFYKAFKKHTGMTPTQYKK